MEISKTTRGRKIAFIADVHSNLEALTTALKEIEKLKPDKLICLGDVVGYGANPNECCELVRKHCDVSILGNHDVAVFDSNIADYFSPYAQESAKWTRRVLKEENIQWLMSLPLIHKEGDLFFSHGAPYSPEDFIYLVSSESAVWSLKFLEASGFKAGFCGHAHITYIFATQKQKDKNLYVGAPESINLDDFETLCINVGSVGQPRDRDPRLAFSILEDNIYTVFRVQYDIETASKKIREAGLPEILSARLFVGR